MEMECTVGAMQLTDKDGWVNLHLLTPPPCPLSIVMPVRKEVANSLRLGDRIVVRYERVGAPIPRED